MGHAVVVALALVFTCGSIASAARAQGLCDEQWAAYQRTQALIQAHNAASPGRSAPPAVAAPYNAEADRLEAQQDAAVNALNACQSIEQLVGPTEFGAAPMRTRAPPQRLAAIQEASKKVPADRQPSGQAASSGGYRVPEELRPLYDALRANNPPKFGNVTLQGRARPKVGEVDPAYPWQTIQKAVGGGPAVSADHIVPLAKLVDLPGFTRLSADNMYLVANAPSNLQWLSYQANVAKKSRSMAHVQGLDPRFRHAQVQLEADTTRRLELLIQRLLAAQR
jgi:hypothetical protein